MKRALLITFIVIIFVLVLTGCNNVGLTDIRKNGSAVQEYNKSIELYNRLAITFSDLVKTIKKEFDNAKSFDDKFWKLYDEKQVKVLQKIDTMREFHYKHQEIAIVQINIDVLIDNIEKYLSNADDYRRGGENYNLIKFEADNDLLYEEILNKSIEITKSFNNIYDNYIIRKKD